GNIEYLGRIDHQVKIRGHRIELGEIDSHVLSYSEAIKNAVTEVKGKEGDKSLVVYYVSSSPIDKHDLSEYLETKLPQYMMPGFYVELESIPLTANGKIDRKRLPKVNVEDLIKNEYAAPRTETEKIMVTLLAGILNYQADEISINDNFFDIGLNSLSIIKLSQLLRKEAGLEIEIAKFFLYPSISELARFIESKESYTEEATEEDKNLSSHIDNLIDNLFE
ncbi:phosphopantetheine-binding protein, partial [Chryseobacterium sp. ON_d1]